MKMTIDITDDVNEYTKVELEYAKRFLDSIRALLHVYIPKWQYEKPANKTWKQMYEKLVTELQETEFELSQKYNEMEWVAIKLGRKIFYEVFGKKDKVKK